LRIDRRLSYVFDFGDERRAFIRVVDRWKVQEDECYPMLVDAEGVVPPQYGDDDRGEELSDPP
jgi:hypothetical protein